MIRTKLLAIAFAALVVTAGVAAAAPGNATADAADDGERHADDRGENATANGNADDRAENAGAASANGSDNGNADDARGPPVDLPDRVPEHVTQIHEQIGSFLSGDLDGSLGDAISELTPGDADESDDADEEESDEDDETDDEDA